MISGGIGYRTRDFGIDFTYVHSTKNEDYYMYTTENTTSNPVQNDYRGQSFSLSLKYYLQ